ncbi:MmgE/PrpD family protein [soil metagenome]
MASLIGRGEMVDMLAASFVNAAAANVLDHDDTQLTTLLHPSAAVFAPVLALAGQSRCDGVRVLHAFAIGIETACRLATDVSPTHYRHGWHITATCGSVGAAAACAWLLRFDESQAAEALRATALQSAGLVVNLGYAAKSVGVGQAAEAGLRSALLVQSGIIECCARAPTEAPICRTEPARWHLHEVAIKPYPCGVVLNPVIEAVLQIAASEEGMPRGAAEIVRVDVEGNELLLERADRPGVQTGREAKLSIQHSVAIALLRRRIGVDEYSDAAVQDPAVMSLRAKVHARAVPDLSIEQARVRVEWQGGVVTNASVDHSGTRPDLQMSDSAVRDKALALFRSRSHPSAHALVEAMWSIDRCRDVSALIDSMRLDAIHTTEH